MSYHDSNMSYHDIKLGPVKMVSDYRPRRGYMSHSFLTLSMYLPFIRGGRIQPQLQVWWEAENREEPPQ